MSDPSVTIIKLDHTGEEVWRYEGKVLVRGESHIVIEAYFQRDDMDMGFETFKKGDRFVETFFTDRWYNIFEIHDRKTDKLKGWYCNLTRPARITKDEVIYDDLALDLWVYPDRETLLLDGDEFAALPLSEADRKTVLSALTDLQAQF